EASLGRDRRAPRVARPRTCAQHSPVRAIPGIIEATPVKQLPMLSTADKLAEIRRLYFNTTRQTIERDIATAIDLLKSMASEEERERATAFMDGLAEMRRDWVRREPKTEKSKGGTRKKNSKR